MGWQRVGHDWVTNTRTTYIGLIKGRCLNFPTRTALLEKLPSKQFENTVSAMCKFKAIIWSMGHFTDNSIAFLNTTLYSIVKHQHACSCLLIPSTKRQGMFGETWAPTGSTGCFPGGTSGKEPTCQCRRWGFNPWVEKIAWRGKWQLTPAFLPWEFHGQRNLESYSSWGCEESDVT